MMKSARKGDENHIARKVSARKHGHSGPIYVMGVAILVPRNSSFCIYHRGDRCKYKEFIW